MATEAIGERFELVELTMESLLKEPRVEVSLKTAQSHSTQSARSWANSERGGGQEDGGKRRPDGAGPSSRRGS